MYVLYDMDLSFKLFIYCSGLLSPSPLVPSQPLFSLTIESTLELRIEFVHLNIAMPDLYGTMNHAY